MSPNDAHIAGYVTCIWGKYTGKLDAQLTEGNVQTRSESV